MLRGKYHVCDAFGIPIYIDQSFIFLLILFIGSMLMISLGIIGYYLAKIYEEVKARPLTIIAINIRNFFIKLIIIYFK